LLLPSVKNLDLSQAVNYRCHNYIYYSTIQEKSNLFRFFIIPTGRTNVAAIFHVFFFFFFMEENEIFELFFVFSPYFCGFFGTCEAAGVRIIRSGTLRLRTKHKNSAINENRPWCQGGQRLVWHMPPLNLQQQMHGLVCG
jgi:hypothetical protein